MYLIIFSCNSDTATYPDNALRSFARIHLQIHTVDEYTVAEDMVDPKARTADLVCLAVVQFPVRRNFLICLLLSHYDLHDS